MRALIMGCASSLAVVLWPMYRASLARPGPSPSLRTSGPWAGMRRPAWWRSRRRSRPDPVVGVLHLLDALGPALRAGLSPAAALEAVQAASGEAGLADQLLAVAAQGSPVGSVWRRFAAQVEDPDVALVAAAWSLCDKLGSPLAPTVALVGDVIRRRQGLRRRVDVAVAGPRATMRLLLGLPVVGPVLAVGMGLSPTQLYAGPTGVAALTAGAALLALGWWWSGRLVRQVFRERSHG